MKQYTITLSSDHLEVVNQALLNMSYRYAAPVIDAINMQVSARNPNGYEESWTSEKDAQDARKKSS